MLKQQRPEELSSSLPVMEFCCQVCERKLHRPVSYFVLLENILSWFPKETLLSWINKSVSIITFPTNTNTAASLGYCSVSVANFTYFHLWFGGFWLNPVHIPSTEISVEIPMVFGDVLWCQQVGADKMRFSLVLNHWDIDRCHLKTGVLCFPVAWKPF